MYIYDLFGVKETIQQTQPKNVILQFPNKEIGIALKTKRELQQSFPLTKFFVLSDHLKTECCVDVIGAKHIAFDIIIHFGFACFTEIDQQVIYVLPTLPIPDIHGLQLKIQEIQFQNDWFLLIDQQYQTEIDRNHLQLNQFIQIRPKAYQDNSIDLGIGYCVSETANLDELERRLFFIGDPTSQLLTKLILQMGMGYFSKIKILNPLNLDVVDQAIDITTTLIKRNRYINKARELNCFGFLIHNATAKFVQSVLKRCKALLRSKNKKYFTFSMNNLSEAKLGNFPEIEAYVIISCYNSSIIDEKQYYKLLITPFDLMYALDDEQKFCQNVGMDQSCFNSLDDQQTLPTVQNSLDDQQTLPTVQNSLVKLQIYELLNLKEWRNLRSKQAILDS